MLKKFIRLIVLIILILLPTNTLAENMKSIIIIVDEMPLERIKELSIDKYAVGLMNLKTRTPYTEENLYLSINAGKKLGDKSLEKEKNNLEFLGDILKKEKVSYIGEGDESLIVGDSKGRVDYTEKSMSYNIDWLLEKTDSMLSKSNVLVLAYDFQEELSRVDTFNQYLENYKDSQIIILPKKVAKEDKQILNKYLVPVIHINDGKSGLLTSPSTKRQGFIAIEDISVQIKNTYGYLKKSDIGSSFQTIDEVEQIEEISHIYDTTINLFIITYIFHGIVYLAQGILGIWLLKSRKDKQWVYFIYSFAASSICISLILGLFEFHKNIFLYSLLSCFLSYIFTRVLIRKKIDLVRSLSILTYGMIVFGVMVYPKMIYNSYIGFNNLIYGARYYGLNNGIMGVLLITSILSFFAITDSINNRYIKNLIGFSIFALNMIVLSANFGANTGGFITSVVLFVLMMYMLCFAGKHSFRKIVLLFLLGISLFVINMILDNSSGDKSHAIEFFYRLKENGIREFISMVSFKARELLILTLSPPFSMVLVAQAIILKKLKERVIKNKKMKEEVMIIIITSLVGFLINDTGVIMLIYMIHYFILARISDKLYLE